MEKSAVILLHIRLKTLSSLHTTKTHLPRQSGAATYRSSEEFTWPITTLHSNLHLEFQGFFSPQVSCSLYAFIISLTLSTCSVHPKLFYFIVVILFFDGNILYNSKQFSFSLLQLPLSPFQIVSPYLDLETLQSTFRFNARN